MGLKLELRFTSSPLVHCSNRTNVGLKPYLRIACGKVQVRSNRTNVGLKRGHLLQ